MNNNMKIRKYKIVNKRRFFRFIFIVLMLILAIVSMFFKRNKVYSSLYEENYTEIMIKGGDTIWNIAKNNMPEEYDIRKMVFEIMEINDLNDAYIYPGDLIKVPLK